MPFRLDSQPIRSTATTDFILIIIIAHHIPIPLGFSYSYSARRAVLVLDSYSDGQSSTSTSTISLSTSTKSERKCGESRGFHPWLSNAPASQLRLFRFNLQLCHRGVFGAQSSIFLCHPACLLFLAICFYLVAIEQRLHSICFCRTTASTKGFGCLRNRLRRQMVSVPVHSRNA